MFDKYFWELEGGYLNESTGEKGSVKIAFQHSSKLGLLVFMSACFHVR